jgi:hypothetical protein
MIDISTIKVIDNIFISVIFVYVYTTFFKELEIEEMVRKNEGKYMYYPSKISTI